MDGRTQHTDPRASLALWLRAGRAQRKLSLDEVAKITKIQARILEKLENGELDGLPAEVFVRGFVRSFAKCVGLDEAEALDRLAECRNAGPLVEAPAAARAFVQTLIAPKPARRAPAPVAVEPAPLPVAPAPVAELPIAVAEAAPAPAPEAEAAADTAAVTDPAPVTEVAPLAATIADPIAAPAAVADAVADAGTPGKKKRTRKKAAGTTPPPTRSRRKKKDAAVDAITAEGSARIDASASLELAATDSSTELPASDSSTDLAAGSLELAAGSTELPVSSAVRTIDLLVEDPPTTDVAVAPDVEIDFEITVTEPWTPTMPPLIASSPPPWRRPTLAAPPPAPSLVIDDSDPDRAEREQNQRSRDHRVSFLPPILLDREDRSQRQGGLTLAVIILLIAATLTLSYLMRRPTVRGDGVTMREVPATLA